MTVSITRLSNFVLIFIAIVLLFAANYHVNATNFCDVCKCFERQPAARLVIECNGSTRDTKAVSTAHEMQYIDWPSTELDTIVANFNHLNLTILPRLQGNPKVAILNFDDNRIRTIGPKPFQFFQQLDTISLRNNFISDISKDFLYGVKQLKHLVLSNNSINSIDPSFMSTVEGVELIDISHNQLNVITPELAVFLGRAHAIDLTHNKVHSLDIGDGNPQWRSLNLGYNKLKLLTTKTFQSGSELKSLNLSHNDLIEIENLAFQQLAKLQNLDLSSNELRELTLALPDSVESLHLGNNSLRLWPLQQVPGNLTRLDVHGNELSEIFPGHDTVNNLKYLNASRNVIDTFPEIQFPHLIALDLSYNLFSEVPPELARYTLQLEELIMDYNPITIITFTEKLRLSKLSLRNMPLVTSIDAFSFSNVEGTKVRTDHTSTCLDVVVSHCDKLEHVSEDAFLGVRLCYLDLSYNQIKKLPSNLTDWNLLQDGVNLQGNPLHCDCDSQWMLDHILVTLYEEKKYQHLLNDLKCGGSHVPVFVNQRFVRFYKHDNAFCDPDPEFLRSIKYDATSFIVEEDQPTISVGSVRIQLTNGVIVIIIVSAVVLGLIVISGIYLTRIQNRKLIARNRRYMT